MPKPGDKIGPYILISKLGRGAFGVVWLAEKRTAITTTKVAIKIPNDEDIDLEAIKQEASLWVHASGHPNVLPIIDADIYDEQVIIVSEYAPDGSLSKWLEHHEGKAPSIEIAVEMTLGILTGLEHLHKRGIIHRDLKPDNILLQNDTPRLADFGIARILKTTSKSTAAATGTPAYMPPEAFDGKRSERTDIWSVGVIFYQLLSGKLPFSQAEFTSLVGAILTKEPEPLPDSIPRAIKSIVERALQKNPAERYGSASDMRQALRDVGQSRQAKTEVLPQAVTELPPTIASPTVASPAQSTASPSTEAALTLDYSPPTPFTRPVPKSKRLIWVIGIAVLFAVGIILALTLGQSTKSSAGSEFTNRRVVVGSKDFTEAVILGEIMAQMLEAQGLQVERRFELAGNLPHDSLVKGDIDLYPEYTGTSYTAILKHLPTTDKDAIYQKVKSDYHQRFGIEVSEPLGFSNDYAILVRGADARQLGLKKISDVVKYAKGWRIGLGQDFMSRSDGYPGFARAYNLEFADERVMDLSLTYRALAMSQVDIIVGNSTDGLIKALDLVQLEDDRRYFIPYDAVILLKRDTQERLPIVPDVLSKLHGAIPVDDMRQLNYEVDGKRRNVAEVAREWRQRKGL